MKRTSYTILAGLIFTIVLLVTFDSAADNVGNGPEVTRASYDIQAMVDAITSTGGLIQLDGIVYTLTEPIVITMSNVTIQGVGWATQIVMADGITESDYHAFHIHDCDNIVLRDMSIDGNKDGQGTYSDTPALILPVDVDGFLVENVEVKNSKGDGVQPLSCENVRIINSYIHDCYQHEVHFNGVFNGQLTGCRIENDNNSLVSMGHNGAQNIVIASNLFKSRSGQGSYMVQAGDADNETLNSDILIVGNTFDINDGLGAVVVASLAHRVVIVGNTFYSLSSSGTAHHILIRDGAYNVEIDHNVFDETPDIYYEE